jgi:hypothetical protein
VDSRHMVLQLVPLVESFAAYLQRISNIFLL